MRRDIQWRLPFNYSVDIQSKISWDAQVYLLCTRCEQEYRLDAAFATFSDDSDMPKCLSCRGHPLRVVRHLESYLYQCLDCGHFGKGVTHGFEELTCESCGSTSIRIPHSKIDPPFPKIFHELFTQKYNPWGVSESEDAQRILKEYRFTNMLPDSGLHSQIYFRFCERLDQYCDYSPADHLILKNVQGQIFKGYFRSSGDLAAGLEVIRISEECANESRDPLNKALMDHNLAMDIFSVLVRYPEELVRRLTGRDDIRHVGVRAAKQALIGVRQYLPKDHAQYDSQVARILHILGDLLRIQNAPPSDLEKAVSYLTEALEIRDLDPRLRANLAESRALSIVNLPNPSRDQMRSALLDFEHSASRDDTARIQAERWTALANSGMLYLKLGEVEESIRRLEQAAALVLHDLEHTLNADELLSKSPERLNVLEGLVRAYGRNDQPNKALDAIETLRSGRLHIQPLSAEDQAQRTKNAVAASSKDLVSTLFGGKPSHTEVSKLKLPATRKETRELAKRIAHMPTCVFTYSIYNEVVTCLATDVGNWKVECLQWNAPSETIGDLRRFLDENSVSARQEFLRTSQDNLHEAFVAPVLPWLRDSGVARIGLCVPRSMGGFSVECVGAQDRLIDSFDVFSLPSLLVGDEVSVGCTPAEDLRVLLVEYSGDDQPHARDELETLRRIWGDAAVVIPGAEATKDAVLEALDGEWSFIHFSCPTDFDRSHPRESAMFVAGTDRPDERITAGELAGMHVQGAPVISLSAGPSTLASYGISNDCTGIPAGFLRCGARGVVGARWPVYDRAPSAFMIQFHERLHSDGKDPIRALCDTKRELSRSAAFEDWAGFGYVGVP